MKPRTLSYLKKKLWKLVSEYVRRSGADRNGNCRCCSCGVLRNWKELQAGHFIDGRSNGILWDLRGLCSKKSRFSRFDIFVVFLLLHICSSLVFEFLKITALKP